MAYAVGVGDALLGLVQLSRALPRVRGLLVVVECWVCAPVW